MFFLCEDPLNKKKKFTCLVKKKITIHFFTYLHNYKHNHTFCKTLNTLTFDTEKYIMMSLPYNIKPQTFR